MGGVLTEGELFPEAGPEVGPPRRLEPVELFLERDHAFKKRDPDPQTGKKRIGCEHCRAGRNAPAHLGAPPSMNDGGSGMDRMAYQQLKKAWMRALGEQLDKLGDALPKGLHAVTVEALVGFPTRASRDQGNHRWMVEKALGDVLVQGGWLEDDSFFPVRRYEFGGLEAQHSPGRSWLRLMLFASLSPLPLDG